MRVLSLALMALALTGCGEGKPSSIAELNRSITGVSSGEAAGQKWLEFDMKPQIAHSGSAFFFSASTDANETLPKLFKFFPEENPDRVLFTLSTDLKDDFGNTKTFKVIQLAFDTADVKKINFQRGQFTSWNLLGHVTNVEFLHPAGKEILRDYCKDSDNATNAALFCKSYVGT
ncbi:hypothetical protein [Pseudomonas protegens]|uniref:hypothetical protein n=1 Tax=Pseudomonas protegens TaxID=380021 RepID=UPI0039060BC0